MGRTKTGRLWTYVAHGRPPGRDATWGVVRPICPISVGASIPKVTCATSRARCKPNGYADSTRSMRAGAFGEAACWAHVRRKFYDLQVAHKSPVAQEALERIAALYVIEKEIRGHLPNERREIRQTCARPLLQSFRQWLEGCLTKLSQKSDTTAAVKYALGRWEALNARRGRW